jgi:uncharacterized metal-binding protein
MQEFNKALIFLCSGAAKAGSKKLSNRIASQLVAIGIADIGTLQDLSMQHSNGLDIQKKMIFINDCRSGCVNVFTQGFDKEKYVFFDVSPFLAVPDFSIEQYIDSEILPKLIDRWSYQSSQYTNRHLLV